MFSVSWIIFISPQTLQLYKVRTGRIVQNFAYQWGNQPLSELILEIQKTHKIKSCRILLSEDFSYLMTISLNKKEDNLRDQLEPIIQENIPEQIKNIVWDYKITHKNGDDLTIQIEAILSRIYQELEQITNRLNIEIIEPIAVTLTESVKKDSAYLLLYSDVTSQAIAVYQGNILSSISLSDQSISEQISQMIEYIKNKFQIEITHFILAGKYIKIAPQIGQVKIDKVSELHRNPILLLSKKNIEHKKDEALLSLQPKTKLKKAKSFVYDDSQNNPWQLAVLFSIVLSLVITLIILIINKQNNAQDIQSPVVNNEAIIEATAIEPEPEIENVSATESSPAANIISPELIDLTQYKIQVLNGSGKAGEASIVEEILLAEGFADFTLANADNYDYQSTQISLKENIPSDIIDTIDRALNSEYQIDLETAELPADSIYDVLIIVGIN